MDLVPQVGCAKSGAADGCHALRDFVNAGNLVVDQTDEFTVFVDQAGVFHTEMGLLPGEFKGELWTAAKGFGFDARYAVGDDGPFQVHAAGTAIAVDGLHALREHDLPDAGTAESEAAGSQEAGREGNAGHIAPFEKGAVKLRPSGTSTYPPGPVYSWAIFTFFGHSTSCRCQSPSCLP